MFLCLSLVIFLSHTTHLKKADSSNHGWRRRTTTTAGSINHMRGWRK
ncbi:unnamed protein product [Brassica oleracea var. botrytis]